MIKFTINGKPPGNASPFRGRQGCISSLFYNKAKKGDIYYVSPLTWEKKRALSSAEIKQYLSLLRRSSIFRGRNMIFKGMEKESIRYKLLPHLTPRENGTLLSLLRYLWESPVVARGALHLYWKEGLSANTSLLLCANLREVQGSVGLYCISPRVGHTFTPNVYGSAVFDIEEYLCIWDKLLNDKSTFRLGMQKEGSFFSSLGVKIGAEVLQGGSSTPFQLSDIIKMYNGKYRKSFKGS